MTWVTYDEGSAVQMANKMVAGLKAAGRNDLVLLSQGAEETAPDNITPGREVMVSFDTAYQTTPGGSPQQRETMANFLNTFLGYGVANAGNTFIAFQNGRQGLFNAFLRAADPYIRRHLSPGIAVGNLSWPMVEELAYDAFFKPFHYNLRRGGLGEELRATIERHQLGDVSAGKPTLAAFYTNAPNNPTGLFGTNEEMFQAQNILDDMNVARAQSGMPPIVHIADNPYFASLPLQNNAGCILRSAYEGVVTMDSPTPTIFVTSFAKALGFATPGVHAITISNTEMAKSFETWIKSKAGFSYFPAAMNHVIQMLRPENYLALKEHFRDMAAKYARNHAILKAALPGMLLDGDPGMVCTMRVPADAMNKVVEVEGRGRLEITSGRGVAEHVANTQGVVAVDQSMPLPDGTEDPLIRFALKTRDEGQMQRGAEGYAAAIAELRAAPSL